MRDEGAGEGRTYGIWGFVALFVLITLVGLALLLFGGGSDSPTIVVPTSQTLPAPPLPPSDAADAGSGDELPDGVSEVLSEEGATSYVFEPPAAADADTATAVVAPMRVSVAEDGRTASLRIGCAASSEEFLGQVVVTEGETAVTFVAVALAPDDGADCVEGAEPRTVELELPRDLDGRAVAVVPAGTAVPQVPGG